MIGLKQKKSSIFESQAMQDMPPPEVKISYAENGFIVSCNYSERYVAKNLKDAFKIAEEHFNKMLDKEEKQDSKNTTEND